MLFQSFGKALQDLETDDKNQVLQIPFINDQGEAMIEVQLHCVVKTEEMKE